MNVYFISGLGADRRVFRYIALPPGCNAEYLDWITPLATEDLAAYSLRLAASIRHEEPFALVGLSMGGMIATEIAKKYQPQATILISSIPVSAHLPPYFKIAGKMKLDQMLPIRFIKSAAITKRFFTAEKPEDKSLVNALIRESDPDFIRWAMRAVLTWKSDLIPGSYIHIHGAKDEILPIRYTRPTHPVPNADHLMVITRPEQINSILHEELSKLITQSEELNPAHYSDPI